MSYTDDFDPSRVLDGWRAPAPAPVELDLAFVSGRVTLDGAKKARLQARGYAMQDVQDIELPHVELLPPFSDVPRAALPGPQGPRPAQLLQAWQPRAWTAQARRVRGPGAEVVQSPHGPLVEHQAPQWLCALWPPQRLEAPVLGRWPEFAALLSAETLAGALQQLLAPLPPEALVWSAELEVDWALIAEVVLHQDARLRPAQTQALRELVEAERGAAFARVNSGYTFDSTVARRRG
jgi:hypothetical protein